MRTPSSADGSSTWPSTLEYLKLLPVSELKIDRGFVIGMRLEPRDAAIVRSAVHLGRTVPDPLRAAAARERTVPDPMRAGYLVTGT